MESTLEKSPANEVQQIRTASANGQKNKLCSALIGWLDFRTLGMWLDFGSCFTCQNGRHWVCLTCFYGFMFINLIDVNVKCHGVKPWCRCGIYHNKQPIGVSPNLQGWSSHGISQVELQGSGRHFFLPKLTEVGVGKISSFWSVVSSILYFHPETLGKWSNLTIIFFRWVENHQPGLFVV